MSIYLCVCVCVCVYSFLSAGEEREWCAAAQRTGSQQQQMM
jgi:hypothetical protein